MNGRLPRLTAHISTLAVASLLLAAMPGATSAAIRPAQAVGRSMSVLLEPGERTAMSVTCPRGMRVTGGGVEFHRPGRPPDPQLHAWIIGSTPTPNGRGWHGMGMTFDDTEPVRMRVRASCLPADAIGAYRVVVRTALVGDDALASVTADCGRGMRIVAGGARFLQQEPDAADAIIRSVPRADGRRWDAAGYGYRATTALRIVLLCRPAKRLAGLTVRSAATPVTATRGGAHVRCPSGKRVLSGGADWLWQGGPSDQAGLTASAPTPDGRGWYAAGVSDYGGILLRVRVLCAPR
jgi:hypothetical protein